MVLGCSWKSVNARPEWNENFGRSSLSPPLAIRSETSDTSHSPGFRAALPVLHRRQYLHRPRVALTEIVLIQHRAEYRVGTRDRLEQRHAGPQLHIVRRAEDLRGRPTAHGKDRLGTFAQPWSEHGMHQVLPSLLVTLD